ncbi:MAG: outer membrane beta-barrel protein [Candidatus Aminicenantia bacterium]
MNYLSGGDINEGLEGWNDLLIDDEIPPGYSVEGEAKPIHLGFDFGGDLIVNITPQIGIGFGVGYIRGTKTSEITYTNGIEGAWTNKPKISAIPIRLGVFYTLLMNEMMNVVFNAGAGLYLAKYFFDNRFEENGYWEEINQEASANGFGVHGGVGFEFNLSPNIAFVLEGQGRYAKIGGFEGTREWSGSGGGSHKEEGTLYYYEVDFFGKKYPLVFVHEDEPSGPFVSNVREAKVDFSGFNFLAGIKIKF